jgi:hypothetical protein
VYELAVALPECALATAMQGVHTSSGASNGWQVVPTVITTTFVDEYDNSASCDSEIRVIDTERPELTCPDDIVIDAHDGESYRTIYLNESYGMTSGLSVTDNVDGVIGTCVITPGTDDEEIAEATTCSVVQPVLAVGSGVAAAGSCSVTSGSGSCEFVLSFPETVAFPHVPNLYIPGSTSSPCAGDSTPLWHETEQADCSLAEHTGDAKIGSTVLTGNKHAALKQCRELCAAQQDCSNIHFRASDGTCDLFSTCTIEDKSDEGHTYSVYTMTCARTISMHGDLFGIGTTEVIFTAMDTFGNEATCSMTVTVLDPEDPVLVCPQTLYVDTQPGTVYGVANVDFYAADNSLQQEGLYDGEFVFTPPTWTTKVTEYGDIATHISYSHDFTDDQELTIPCSAGSTSQAACEAITGCTLIEDVEVGTALTATLVAELGDDVLTAAYDATGEDCCYSTETGLCVAGACAVADECRQMDEWDVYHMTVDIEPGESKTYTVTRKVTDPGCDGSSCDFVLPESFEDGVYRPQPFGWPELRTSQGFGYHTSTCTTLVTVTERDDCAAAPCQNGGTCIDEVADYRCECVLGY